MSDKYNGLENLKCNEKQQITPKSLHLLKPEFPVGNVYP